MTTPTLPDLTGFTEHYGIRLTYVGDDGDWIIALGHHGTRRFLAAINRMHRIDLGNGRGGGLAIDTGWDYHDAASRIEQGRAILATACGDHPNDANDPDCCECREIAEAGWWLRWGDDETPGAFPITILNAA